MVFTQLCQYCVWNFCYTIHDVFRHLQDEVDIPYLLNHLNLTRWLNTCQNLQNDMRDTINGYSLMAKQEAEAGSVLQITAIRWSQRNLKCVLSK